ncbi:MAG: methylenetetrahydrofolate reductase [NAD(P)H] [Phycisphaeraceae bacterium]|nr:methylenetetrahydrofolate reductase [NAD(P)H] [Phycisphaeraceae bacterium]
MHIRDILAQHATTFSFEFFPPKTPEAAESLYTSITELESLKPSFVSVTYGAGGSTREVTHDLVVRLKAQTRLDPVPHLTCVCHTAEQIRSILERYAGAGIGNILALGGDVPKTLADYDRSKDAYRYAADLVRAVRAFNDSRKHPDPRGFGVCVAGYPEGHPATPNRVKEMDYLKAKVDAGADWICTQLFFDNKDFFDFRDRCEIAGIKVPIVAGIMPVSSVKGMLSMADMALGCRFPAPLLRAINRTDGDPERVRRVGVQWATQQCRELLDQEVRGIHFYTLNRSTATREVFLNLGVTDTLTLLHAKPVIS